jgi:hypothetical protein
VIEIELRNALIIATHERSSVLEGPRSATGTKRSQAPIVRSPERAILHSTALTREL